MSSLPTHSSYIGELAHVFIKNGFPTAKAGVKLSENHPSYPAFAAMQQAILKFPEEHLSLVKKASPKARKKRKSAASLMTYNPYQGARMALWGGIPKDYLISMINLTLPELDAHLLTVWIREMAGGSGKPVPAPEE